MALWNIKERYDLVRSNQDNAIGNVGLFAGGSAPSDPVNTVDSINFLSLGNATDYGDLSVAREVPAGFSNRTAGFYAGGHTPSDSNVIDRVEFATAGNFSDFGDLTTATRANSR